MSSDLYVLSCLSIIGGRTFKIFSILKSWASESPVEYTAELSEPLPLRNRTGLTKSCTQLAEITYEQNPVFLKESEQQRETHLTE